MDYDAIAQQYGGSATQAGTQSGPYGAFQAMLKARQNPQPQQPDQSGSSFGQQLLEDPFKTLIAKPGARIGQAIAAPFVQNKMDSTTSIQNQQTDQLNTVLAKLKAEQDPAKKAKLAQMAHKLVDQATQNTAEGQQAVNQQNQISDTQHVAGMDIEGQKGGAKGVQQIAGDALKSASYLTGGEGAGEVAGGKITQGAIAGAKVGAMGGAGQSLEDPNATLGSVAKGTAEGTALGAATGAAIPAAVEGVQKGSSALGKIGTKAPEDLAASRVADATPHYHKDMVGDSIVNAKGETVPRVNEGEGVFGNRTVNTSKSEAANAEELAKLKNYPDKGTALQKSQAVYKEIKDEAKRLRSTLAEEDKAKPLDTEKAKDQVYKNILDHMDGDARDAVITRGKVSSIKGLSDADAAALGGKVSKTTLGQYGRDVADEMGKYNGTREGLLELRQNLDDVYKDYRGKSAFGSDHRNALDDMHKSVREYINNELHESTANADIKASFEKQTRLYRAKDVLDAKAEAEATSAAGRFGQRHPNAKMFSRRMIMRTAAGAAGGALGLSLLNSTINKTVKNAVSGQ